MRMNIVSASLLCLTSFLTAASRAETATQYLVQVTLTGQTPDGRPAVLMAPRLVVLEGKEGCVHIGDTLAPPTGITVNKPMRTGASLKVKVLRKDDRLLIDATASESAGKSDADGTELVSTGVHAIKAITSGKKITVSAGVGITRWELLVRECKPEDLRAISDEGPTAARVSEWKPEDLKPSANGSLTTARTAAVLTPRTVAVDKK